MTPDLRARLMAIAFVVAFARISVEVVEIEPGCRCWFCLSRI